MYCITVGRKVLIKRFWRNCVGTFQMFLSVWIVCFAFKMFLDVIVLVTTLKSNYVAYVLFRCNLRIFDSKLTYDFLVKVWLWLKNTFLRNKTLRKKLCKLGLLFSLRSWISKSWEVRCCLWERLINSLYKNKWQYT